MEQNFSTEPALKSRTSGSASHKPALPAPALSKKALERARKNAEIEAMVADYHESRQAKVREKILIANLSLISFIAERLAISLPQSVELDDLKSLGILGLIDAIEHYKPEKQVRFTSYAALRIKGSIIDGLRSLDWVPRSVRKKARDLEKSLRKFEAELGRPPSGQEMSQRLQISLTEYQTLLREVSPITFLSLNDTVYEDEDQSISLGDVIEDSETYGPHTMLEREEVKQLPISGINSLPDREKLVVALYY